jgi:3-phenylpropionate/cinnamic acid dioxygenase small subunit
MPQFSDTEVKARSGILDVLARYAYALDQKQYDLLTDVFTADAHIDMSSSDGIAGDRTAFIAWIPSALALFPMTQHMLGQSVIDFDSAFSSARVHTYQSNPMGFARADGSIHLFVIGGHYDDRCVPTDAGWRISERTWVQRWVQGELPAEMVLPGRVDSR